MPRFDQPIEPMTLGNMRELRVRTLLAGERGWRLLKAGDKSTELLDVDADSHNVCLCRVCGRRRRCEYRLFGFCGRSEMQEGRSGDGHFRASRYRRRPGWAAQHLAARVFPDPGAVRGTLTDRDAMRFEGLHVGQLAVLVVEGLATMQRRPAQVGGRERTVVWMQITEEGRHAIEQSAMGRLDKPAGNRRVSRGAH
jgi:hypothetical protein